MTAPAKSGAAATEIERQGDSGSGDEEGGSGGNSGGCSSDEGVEFDYPGSSSYYFLRCNSN